ncbi:MAG: insulinase family protein [Tannerellaceae bacterium]|jgi:predicted Zn-dependent peptidase|nr:insulinase family protein [Tannerellaceae bacterium]
MNYYVHTFQNGLRAIHLPLDSPVSYCGFGIKAGARNENADEFGLAHFVEHMLFKGTQKRKAWHILNRMENVGGELNAFTSKEETFVYSVFPAEYFQRALELLIDIVFNSKFPQNEIEKETEVILDEINSYKDSPSELIFDEFENILFRNHALGHNILGDESSLTRFNTELAASFTRCWYLPGNMIFFSMGNIPFSRIIRMLDNVPDRTDVSAPLFQKLPPERFAGGYERINRNTHQAHVIIGGRSYGMFESSQKRAPLLLLNNLLGGPGMNSRLNLSLREKNGLAYTVESSVATYTDTGMASIYFGTHAKSVERAVGLVRKELEVLRSGKLTALQLSAIKKQFTGQMLVGMENRESLFLHAGKHFLHHNRYYTLAERISGIEKVTGEEILAAANEIFSPGDLFTLVYE